MSTGDKFAAATLIVALLGLPAAWLAVPGFKEYVKSKWISPSGNKSQATQPSIQETSPMQPAPTSTPPLVAQPEMSKTDRVTAQIKRMVDGREDIKSDWVRKGADVDHGDILSHKLDRLRFVSLKECVLRLRAETTYYFDHGPNYGDVIGTDSKLITIPLSEVHTGAHMCCNDSPPLTPLVFIEVVDGMQTIEIATTKSDGAAASQQLPDLRTSIWSVSYDSMEHATAAVNALRAGIDLCKR